MSNLSKAQSCDCESNFKWVKEVFEVNDAGFAMVLENKGKEAYDQLTEKTLMRVKEIDDLEECMDAITDWLLFFRKGHIGVESIVEEKTDKQSKKAIRAKFKDWERWDGNTKTLEKELLSTEKDGYEGVWKSGIYKIGVVKDEQNYVGVILKADGTYWLPGQVKFRINPNDPQQATYYMQDHSEMKFEAALLLDANHLHMGHIELERFKPKIPSDETVLTYLKAMESNMPYLEALDDETNYLRLPSFNLAYRSIIDKLILEKKEEILNKPYLIIDIRNNGGGSDDSYDEVIPLLYTQPIELVGAAIWSTPLNNKGIKDAIDNPKLDEETREDLLKLYEKLKENEGSFVNLDDEKVSYVELDEVLPNPKKVAILINENNASAAEEFLLAARQSTKVTLFGRNTSGILDISNVNVLTSPSQEFVLAYSLSKSYRIPEKAIDGVGVTPDVPIPGNVADYKWVEFTLNHLKEK